LPENVFNELGHARNARLAILTSVLLVILTNVRCLFLQRAAASSLPPRHAALDVLRQHLRRLVSALRSDLSVRQIGITGLGESTMAE
jgi:hypothetical protein